jgi:hypothetical protein
MMPLQISPITTALPPYTHQKKPDQKAEDKHFKCTMTGKNDVRNWEEF